MRSANNVIDISTKGFTLFFEDISKIYNLMKEHSFNIAIVRKITKNKKYHNMDHFNVLNLINKIAAFNIVKEKFKDRLQEIDVKSLNIEKVKLNYKKKDITKKEEEKTEEEKDIEEDEEKKDDDKDLKLVDLGIDDGIFRYLYFIDLECKFLKIQLKKAFLSESENTIVYVNNLIDIITTHIFSKYKDNIYILDINLQKQALNKYFNNMDDNTCSICLTGINTELTNHHTLYCLSCSAIYCIECHNKVKPFCSICRHKL